MKLTITIRCFCWKHWLFIKNYRFHRQRTKRHMFQLESNIACEDYMVRTHKTFYSPVEMDVLAKQIAKLIGFNFLFCFHLGFRLQSTKCMSIVDLWKKFQHSNVVQLREVFTTKGFGDQCKHSTWIFICFSLILYFYCNRFFLLTIKSLMYFSVVFLQLWFWFTTITQDLKLC